jgi:hypothetical protein
MDDKTIMDADARRGFLQRLAGVFFSPSEEFADVVRRPRFLAPLLGAVVLNVVFTVLWVRNVDPAAYMRARIEESPQAARMEPEQRAQVIAQQAQFFPVFVWLGPVFALLFVTIVASLYLFVFRFFLASEVDFPQSITVVAWSFFAVGLVTTPLTLLVLHLKGDWTLEPQNALQANLSVFLERGSAPAWLYTLAGSFDLFSFWMLFLMAAGFAAASRRTFGSALGGVLSLWVIYVLGKAGLAALF